MEAVVIALKFLAPGAVSPFSRVAWPPPAAGSPGAWISASPGSGAEPWIHACRPADLPYWMERELWRVELSDPAREVRHEVQAERGRLLEKVDAWDARAAHEFALDCARRTCGFAAEALRTAGLGELAAALLSFGSLDDLAGAVNGMRDAPDRARQLLGYCGDAAFFGKAAHPGCVSYIAAIAAADLRGDAAGARDERAWQAGWLCDRLGIAR